MSNEWGDNKDITYFGKTNFRSTNQLFGIRRKDRRQHMYVLGKSGTGKSVLLSNLIIQNIKNGEGVCVIDPHGELVQEILASIPPERVKDTVYFNPGDIDYHVGFNVLELEDPNYKHLVASGIMGIFTKIWANAWSSRMEYILNNAILALLDTPGSTLLGIPRLLVDKDYRQQIIANLKDPVVKAFWVHEYEAWRDQFRNEAIAPIQNKVGQFLSTSIVRNVVGQSKSTIDIFDIMNSGKIFLVNVSKGRVGEDNSALLGGMLITKIQLAAMERVRIPEAERKDFYLYVDEFQNFVTESFANILSEARKYRLNLTIAHQYIGQLETINGAQVRDAVFGNVGTMIIFRVGAQDADFLEKEFEPEFTPQDLVNLPNYNIYLKLMVDGVASRPFSATTLPPIVVEHSEEVTHKVIETSRALYMRPRKEVEDDITKWSTAPGGRVDENSLDANGNKPTMSQTMGGKFDAKCSSCGKDIKVPFEPQAGRPVYCRECLEKIKSGELSPVLVSGPRTKQMEDRASDTLAALGIEFTPANAASIRREPTSTPRPVPNMPRPTPVRDENRTSAPVAPIIKSDPTIREERKSINPTPGKVSIPKPEERSSQSPQPLKLQLPIPPKAEATVSQPVVVSTAQNSHPAVIRPRNTNVLNLKSAIHSALSEIGLMKELPKKLSYTQKIDSPLPPKPEPKPTVSLSTLKPAPIVSASINTKTPTEKNMSALKEALAAAMGNPFVLEQKKESEPEPEFRKRIIHTEVLKELAEVDRIHADFLARKQNTVLDHTDSDIAQAEALRIVREKEKIFAAEDALLKQQSYDQKQKSVSEQTEKVSPEVPVKKQSYTPRQPKEIPEDVLRKVLE